MARLRAASAYRRLKRSYTRKSKVRAKSYIKSTPQNKIVRYVMGNKRNSFPCRVDLISLEDMNLRHNAIEAGRRVASNYLEKTLNRENFKLEIRTHPHHILRENPLATGAGADRFQEGMTRAFGKPIGLAARVKKGKILVSVYVNEKGTEEAKRALKKVSHKYPMRTTIRVSKP
ncbi:MAG: 50S ribosomal protein L16 [Candidatus Woesearchaeota archaeon]|nr:MAG: 50S ribosomal protein L16 [Candidatus Woesearchaeota archaeon]